MTGRGDLVDEIASGFRRSQILFSGLRLGVFDVLSRGPLAADGLADALGADSRGTRILADALVALGLLEKDDEGRYRNRDEASEELVSGARHDRVALLLHSAALYQRWGRLVQAVRTGEPVEKSVVDPELDRGTEGFAEAMRDVGRRSAELLADALDLTGVRRFLDVGGGPGVYAAELARRIPDLRAVVLDRSETAAIARRNVERAGLGERIAVRAGDAFEADLGGPWDLVLLSNVLHVYGSDQARALVRRCSAALGEGGRLVVKDFLLDPDRTSPEGGAIFAVNMLVATEEGDCHTEAEVREWMEGAGLGAGPVIDLTPQTRILVGVRRNEPWTERF